MNLKSFFNFSYFKQNLKKSKVTLAFMLLILPVLTFIMLLMIGKRQEIMILDLSYVSGLTAFGMYLIPAVISLLLFNFVFKKKSVDFMGSMPIDRKTLFFTNTIGGILILIGLLFATTVLMFFASMILPNLYIPLGVCLDYFVLFSISYIFVFTACNIAISLSGNVATSIIVLLLILFFVPFHHYVFSSISWNVNFDYKIYHAEEFMIPKCDEDDAECQKSNYSEVYFRPIREDLNYTMPFGIFANSTDLSPNTLCYREEVVGKMAVLSLLYIFIGCLLFEKKEMEVCETSFKKYWQHQLVKFLTLIPIFIMVSLALYEVGEFSVWIFVIAIVLIYNFIYDLLTKHSIEHIFINLVCFSFAFMLVSFTTTHYLDQEKKFHYSEQSSIELKDIETVQIEAKYLGALESEKPITIDDSKIIKDLFADRGAISHNAILVVTIDDLKYQVTSYLTDELKKKILEFAKTTSQHKEENLNEILKNKEVITIGNNIQVLDQEGIRLLEKAFQNQTEERYNIPLPINIYKYKDHSLKCYTIYSNIDEQLQRYILNSINQKTRKEDLDQVYTLKFDRIEQSNFVYTTQYVVSGSHVSEVIEQFQKTHSIDLKQPIYRVTFQANNKNFYYYTNLDEKLLSILHSYEVELETVSPSDVGEEYDH